MDGFRTHASKAEWKVSPTAYQRSRIAFVECKLKCMVLTVFVVAFNKNKIKKITYTCEPVCLAHNGIAAHHHENSATLFLLGEKCMVLKTFYPSFQ